jgi:hypothetical protein
MARRSRTTKQTPDDAAIDVVLEADTTRPATKSANQPDSPVTHTAASYRGASTGLKEPDENYLMGLRVEKQAE